MDLDQHSPVTGSLEAGSLQTGSLKAERWLRVYRLGPPMLDLDNHSPVLEKNYRGPFNVNVVWGKTGIGRFGGLLGQGGCISTVG